MSEYKLKRIDHIVLEDMWGIGVEVARNDFWEYSWWECELHITLAAITGHTACTHVALIYSQLWCFTHWDDVVNGHVLILCTTVVTHVPISCQYSKAYFLVLPR